MVERKKSAEAFSAFASQCEKATLEFDAYSMPEESTVQNIVGTAPLLRGDLSEAHEKIINLFFSRFFSEVLSREVAMPVFMCQLFSVCGRVAGAGLGKLTIAEKKIDAACIVKSLESVSAGLDLADKITGCMDREEQVWDSEVVSIIATHVDISESLRGLVDGIEFKFIRFVEKKVADTIAALKKHMIDTETKVVRTIREELIPIARGAGPDQPAGSSWSADFTGNTLKDLLSFAAGTLLLTDGNKVKRLHGELDISVKRLLTVVELFGGNSRSMDYKTEGDESHTPMCWAVATMDEAKLIDAIAKHLKNPVKLKSIARGVLTRAKSGSADFIHPLLLKAAQDADRNALKSV